jgi:hypothetical protein
MQIRKEAWDLLPDPHLQATTIMSCLGPCWLLHVLWWSPGKSVEKRGGGIFKFTFGSRPHQRRIVVG